MSVIPGNNVLITASQIVGSTKSVIIRIPTSNSNDTFDTALNIILAYWGADDSIYIGNSFLITIYNDSTFTITLNPGSNTTMYPTSTDTILPQVSKNYLFNFVSLGTLNVYLTASAAASNSSGLTLPNSEIFIGNSSNIATAVPVTGDITLTDTGLSTVIAINTTSLGSTTATSGNLLIANGSQWITQTIGSNYSPTSDIASLSSSGMFALNTTGVTANSYTTANITVDSKGRITFASNGSISPGTITLTDNHILVGNVSNIATDVPMSGDATIVASGDLTLNTVNLSPGSTTLSSITTNGKGLVTSNATGNLTGDVSSVGLTTSYNNIVPILKGGTSVSSVTIAPTATAWAGWDINRNMSANNFLEGYTTTVTAAGTTVLTVASTYQQYFTGTSSQTVIMPQTSTLVSGQEWIIVNNSTGSVTVETFIGSTIVILTSDTYTVVTCILTNTDTLSAWTIRNTSANSIELPTNYILVGNASDIASPVPMSGDATIVSSGALTLDTVNLIPGSTTLSSITTNAKGLVTSNTTGNLTGDITSSGLITSYNITVPINKGGTGVSSVTIAPTATAWAGWDINRNMSANNFIEGYATTVTAAGITVLIVSSAYQQFFTGTSTETVIMPQTSTLVAGQAWNIVNNSTSSITVETYIGDTIVTLAPNTETIVTCILTSSDTNSAWTITNISVNPSFISLPTNEILVGNALNVAAAVSMSGDATLVASGALTLSTVNVSPGSTTLSSITTNGKGLVTSNVTGNLTGDVTSIGLTTSYNNIVPLTLGGTNASLIASDGGIVYSDVSELAILSATSTANQIILSGSNSAPSWSTAIYPSTTIINQLLYSSSSNTITGLPAVDSSVLTSSAGGVPTWTSILTIPNGGTGVSSVTTVPTPVAWAGWDTNSNMSANNFLEGYTTIVTSAGTTVLTVSSPYQQYFTGTSTQTVQMPVASTLVLGQAWNIVNNSTGSVSVQSSGSNLIILLPASTQTIVTCILTAGTTAASWSTSNTVISPGAIYLPTNEILVGNASNIATAVSMSGDATIVSSGALTLSTVNVSPGSTTLSSITTNGKGLVTANTTGNLTGDVTSVGLTTSYNNIVPILKGGTGVSSVTTVPTPVAWAGWDTNSNMSANNFLEGYTTTVTTGGITTLTVASTFQQYFTGTNPQTVVMPVTSTLVLGQAWNIVNNSTGSVTIESSGINTIIVLAASTQTIVTCILTSGTTAASWSTSNITITPGAIPLPTNEILVGNASNVAAAVNMSGDATIVTSGALTLATVNVSPGSTTLSSITTNGKGLVTSNTTGNLTGNVTSVGLTTSYNSIVPLNLGGTNANLTASAGSITYSGLSALALSTVGTSGQVLTSAGSSAPTWTTATAIPTASAIAEWDINVNMSANNFIEGYTTTVTAAGTTTLTVASSYQQYFTGTTTQNVVMPVVSTLVLGQQWIIVNNSTGLVTVQSSGSNTIVILAGSTQVILTVVLTSGTSPASWSYEVSGNTSVTSVSGTTNQITVSPNTGAVVVSISATYPGQSSITTLGTIGTGTWQGTPIALAYGGTNANLTASNGGIFYSTSSAGAILSGTATADQVLLSGSSSSPSWSTATYPSTTAINQLLYSSAANTISGLATNNSAVLVTSAGGVPSLSTTLPNINLGTPTAVVLTNGTGLPLTTGVTGVLPLANGGTNANLTASAGSITYSGASALALSTVGTSGQVLTSAGTSPPTWTTATATPTASAIAEWDINTNMSANNFIEGYTTTATSASTTTLTVSSTYQQYFTGSTIQNVVMPVVSTLVLGQSWNIVNNSTGNVTVQSSGLNTIIVLAASTEIIITCILTTGTSAASWSTSWSSVGVGVTSVSGTTNQITVSPNTGAVVVGISATYPGQSSITTLGTISTGTWQGTPVALAYGGTNANLTASNGGIFYSTSSAGAILSGTATADQVLLSGSSSSPSWSTATYPSTTVINQLLYSSVANTITGLATVDSAVLVTSAGGVPSLSTTLPNINLGTPTAVVLTNGTGLPLTTGVTGVLPLANGGTNANLTASAGSITYSGASALALSTVGTSGQVLTSAGSSPPTWTTATATPTASAIVEWDTNKNISANNFIEGYTTTVTAGGTTTLTVSNSYQQYFTGSTTQTVVMPVVSTLVLGQQWNIVNNSTGNVTVQSSGSNTIVVLTGSTQVVLTVILTSGTSATSWSYEVSGNTSVTSVSGTTNQITVSPTTGAVVVGISATYPGQTSITTLGTIGTGTWQGTLIALAYGGTNANLTASNGGIFYSTSSAGAILSGTATANQVLLSGSSSSPSWSTATYPSTTTINQILYSSAANTITGLATVNSAVLVTSAGGVPSLSTTLPNINLGTPTAVVLTNGTGLPLTSGVTGILPLANGGTNANLTASNGGIFYSTSSAGAILSGTSTANQIILSGANTTPSWSTTTWPSTVPVNELLYASFANVISGFSTTASCVLTSTAGSVPTWTSILTIPNGGTGVNSVTTAPTATAWAGWDSNKNMSANNFIDGYTTTITAAGTTTLLVSSTYEQYFTGSTTQTVAMPVVSTLVLGQAWNIVNNSTGNVTVQSSGLNTIIVLAASTQSIVTCILTTGTTAASWSASWSSVGVGVTSVSGTTNQITVSPTTGAVVVGISATYPGQSSITTLGTIGTGTWQGTPVALAYGGTNANLTASNGGIFYSTSSAGAILSGTATANQVLLSGSSSSPSWSTATYPSTSVINQLLYSSATNTITGLATVNSNVLTTSSGGVPTWVSVLTIPNGGTGVNSVTTVPAATAWAGWDTNKNMSANNFIEGYATTITAAGTTTLLVSSANQQFFTGSSTQTVLMPVTSTLVLGQQWTIVNNSTGNVTIQSSGANNIVVLFPNTDATLTCILTSGTTQTSWNYEYSGWNINANLQANNFIDGYTTTATAAGTTTLTIASTYQQFFTGTTTQIIVLPVTSTLVLGQEWNIINNSTGVITVQSSGANTITTLVNNTQAIFTCILTSGTTAASWYYETTVGTIQGISVSTTYPVLGQELAYGPTSWMPTTNNINVISLGADPTGTNDSTVAFYNATVLCEINDTASTMVITSSPAATPTLTTWTITVPNGNSLAGTALASTGSVWTTMTTLGPVFFSYTGGGSTTLTATWIAGTIGGSILIGSLMGAVSTSSVGGLIRVPSGRYNLSTPWIVAYQGVQILGDGATTETDAGSYAMSGGSWLVWTPTTPPIGGSSVFRAVPTIFRQTVTSITVGNPTTITTATPHGIQGNTTAVVISNATGVTTINGEWIATPTGASTYTIAVSTSGTYTANSATSNYGTALTAFSICNINIDCRGNQTTGTGVADGFQFISCHGAIITNLFVEDPMHQAVYFSVLAQTVTGINASNSLAEAHDCTRCYMSQIRFRNIEVPTGPPVLTTITTPVTSNLDGWGAGQAVTTTAALTNWPTTGYCIVQAIDQVCLTLMDYLCSYSGLSGSSLTVTPLGLYANAPTANGTSNLPNAVTITTANTGTIRYACGGNAHGIVHHGSLFANSNLHTFNQPEGNALNGAGIYLGNSDSIMHINANIGLASGGVGHGVDAQGCGTTAPTTGAGAARNHDFYSGTPGSGGVILRGTGDYGGAVIVTTGVPLANYWFRQETANGEPAVVIGTNVYAGSAWSYNGSPIESLPQVAAGSPISNTEAIVAQLFMPANSLHVGSTYRLKTTFTFASSATSTTSIKLRLGTAGTTGDTAIITQATATTGVADNGMLEAVFTVRTLGGAGTCASTLQTSHGLAATGFAATANTFSSASGTAIATTSSLFLSLTALTGAASNTITPIVSFVETISQ